MDNTRYEYKVEEISTNLQNYLNIKASEGWRCVGVTKNTGLGWTMTVILERPLQVKE